MEILAFFFALCGLILVFSGPIALCWCSWIHSKIRNIETQNAQLSRQLSLMQRGLTQDEVPIGQHPIPLKSVPVPQTDKMEPVFSESESEKWSRDGLRDWRNFAESASKPILSEISAEQTTSNANNDADWEQRHSIVASVVEKFSWQSWELWIGRKFLGWVAVGALVLSAALFVKVAVDEGWIGRIPPTFRVLGLALVGTLLIGVGKHFHRTGWTRFSTMISSAGILIVFQAGYASYAFYELVSITAAGAIMSLIVLGAFLLSWHYTSKLLGILSIVGGLAVPFLVKSPVDTPVQFFTYLIILNVATVMLVNLLRRAPIGFIAFFGTQVEFWLWYNSHYIHPDKLAVVLIFQALFYVVYFADTLLAWTIPWRLSIGKNAERLSSLPTPTWDDAVRTIFSPIILFGTLWCLLRTDPIFSPWLGVVAFIGATWYALLSILYWKRLCLPSDQDCEQIYSTYWKAGTTAATVIALGFVGVGIPIQFSASWVALGWITVFAGLWYFGHRQENPAFIVLAYIFASLGVLRLALDIFHASVPTDNLLPIPVFNRFAVPPLAASLMMIAVTTLTHRLALVRDHAKKRTDNFLVGLIGFGFCTALLSVETHRFFQIRSEWYEQDASLWSSIFISVLWSLLAMLLLQTGGFVRSLALRRTGLIFLAIVALKMIFVDLAARTFFVEPIFNPYCPCLIFISLLLMGAGIQGRTDRRLDKEEVPFWSAFGVVGIFTLLGILSVECLHFVWNSPEHVPGLMSLIEKGQWDNFILGVHSLSVLWTVYAMILLGLGCWFQPLRICGLVVLGTLWVKIVLLDIVYHPTDAFVLINPYFLSTLFPALCVMVLAVWTSRIRPLSSKAERVVFAVYGVFGILALWATLSSECYHVAKLLQDAPGEAWKAQMFLSILWSVFAGILIFIGFVGRSEVLRWMSILLFATTLTKVLLVDMSGFHGLYRLGAVFILAVVLTLTTWAYQRFKPERIIDNAQRSDW